MTDYYCPVCGIWISSYNPAGAATSVVYLCNQCFSEMQKSIEPPEEE